MKIKFDTKKVAIKLDSLYLDTKFHNFLNFRVRCHPYKCQKSRSNERVNISVYNIYPVLLGVQLYRSVVSEIAKNQSE